MTFLLDTNTVVAVLNPEHRDVLLRKITSRQPGEVVTSAIVAHELYHGAHKSRRRDDNLARLAMLFRDVEPLPFACEDAEAAGSIRAALATSGTPVGPYDVLIAGQAKARGAVLVTNNTREFHRVEDLTVADWLSEE